MHVALIGAELEENLALAYLRGALESEGHRVTQVSFDSASGLESAADQIARSGADVAGFSMVFTARAREFARLATRCRHYGFAGLSVAGGHFAAFHAEQLLADVPALDAVAVGEGERILCDVAGSPNELARVAGLVWRDGASVRRNPPAQPEQNLDCVPWPARRPPFGAYLGLPIANMIGSRGCTHACAFCSIAAWHKLCGGARYRSRSTADIASEMGCLWRQGVRLFNFHDDNFLGRDRDQNLQRVRSLRDELARRGVGKMAFQIKARPDSVDLELFAFLRSMGLFRVFLGIEAGTELSLQHLGRGQRLADNVRALQILNDLDLHVAFNLLVLNPDSTLEDFAGNVAFLREHVRNPMNFCRTEVYAGTPLERKLRKQGRLHGDYWGLDYRIADERAQSAFELFSRAFYERNFGSHPLHYLSGRVDYEHQVRADLVGTTAELKARAKRFVRAVNENTVAHLEAIIAAITEGRADGTFARELAWRVARDDIRLHAEGESVLARIRALPRPAASASRRSSAAIAASMALALASCSSDVTPKSDAQRHDGRSDVTQHYEAAPQPSCAGDNWPPYGPREPYNLTAQAVWVRAGSPLTDAAPPKPDSGKSDGGGALAVGVTVSISSNNYSEPKSFTSDPALTGGHLLATKRETQVLTFQFAPDPGVSRAQAVVKIDCASIPNTATLTFTIGTPVAGGQVQVTQQITRP